MRSREAEDQMDDCLLNSSPQRERDDGEVDYIKRIILFVFMPSFVRPSYGAGIGELEPR